MKSFSQSTKEAICKTVGGKGCCIDAEIIGFLLFAGRLRDGVIRVSSESREVMKHFAVLVKRSTGSGVVVEDGKNNFYCNIPHKKIMDMFLRYETSEVGLTELFNLSDCCRNALLKGAFLGGATMIDPSKSYNLEFISPSSFVRDDFKAFLDEMGLEFKSANRRNSFVLYSKQSDTICDVLTIVGAHSAQMEVLNVKIEKEVRNDWVRIINSENANFDKVVTAAVRQIRAIDKIESTIGIDSLPEELQQVARLRLENKNLSLDALGKKLTPPLSKSGVNHRIKKILEIAEERL